MIGNFFITVHVCVFLDFPFAGQSQRFKLNWQTSCHFLSLSNNSFFFSLHVTGKLNNQTNS